MGFLRISVLCVGAWAVAVDNAEYRDDFGWSCRDYQRVPYECAKLEDARKNCPVACGQKQAACDSIREFVNDACNKPQPEYPWVTENRRRMAAANRCPSTDLPGLLAPTQIRCELDADDFPTGNTNSAQLSAGLTAIESRIRNQYTNACDNRCQGITVGGSNEICISFIQPSGAIEPTNRPTPKPTPSPVPGSTDGGFPWWLILLMVLSILTLCCCCLFWAWYFLFMQVEEDECDECEGGTVVNPTPIGYPVAAGGSFAAQGTLYGVDANRDGVISSNEMGFMPKQQRCAYTKIDDCNECDDGTQIPVPY